MAPSSFGVTFTSMFILFLVYILSFSCMVFCRAAPQRPCLLAFPFPLRYHACHERQ